MFDQLAVFLTSNFLDLWNEFFVGLIVGAMGTIVVPVSLLILNRVLDRRKETEARLRLFGERIARLEGPERPNDTMRLPAPDDVSFRDDKDECG